MPSIREALALSPALSELSESPRLDLEVLLSHVLERDRSYLFTWPERELTETQYSLFHEMFARRKAGEPIAHIIGEREFWSLMLYCDASTLIPRPDTEVLVEKVLALSLNPTSRVLDLGTGTGAIALALASERPQWNIEGVDSASDAIALALRNAARHRLNNAHFYQSSWFTSCEGHYDLIVSNPPYIDKDDIHLQQGDVRFEPSSALVASGRGLDDIHEIVKGARDYMNPNACLMIEHGWQQGEDVRTLFTDSEYSKIDTLKDYGGNERATLGFFRCQGGV